ncbi:tellurite resistance TerB family protein [Mycoplana ramosa]|uniref:Tellurite resistance TerB family protein n=1 Tax=Mycoplana ramosa TaxID=40837 RepID=A0ABW3YWJ6_MYCRA
MTERNDLQEALVQVMVIMSAVDNAMTDAELARIGRLARSLPVFDGYDDAKILHAARECTVLLAAPEGLDVTLEVIRERIPARFADTAYAVAVEIAAADQRIRNEEIRLLQMLRDRLGLDKLTCAAIERAAIARLRRH